MKRVTIGLVGLVVLGGCGSAGDPGQLEVNLSAVADCVDLEQTIRAAARKEMNARLDAQMESILQAHTCRGYAEGDSLNAVPAPAGGAASAGSSGASQVSGTNNQVAGVDEADFIKNDNKFIYVVSKGTLRILQAWPAPTTQQLSKVAIEGTPRKLFVQGDRALVYSSLTLKTGYKECTYGYNCSFVGDGNPTKVTIFDISDRTAPRLVRELRFSGSYVNARRIGDDVHTVVTSPGVSFPSLSYSPQGISACNSYQTPWEVYLAFATLRARNTKIIDETPMESFVPSLTDSVVVDGALQTTKNLLGSCDGFYRSSLGSGTSFTTIVSLSMTAETPAASATIVSRPGAIYSSAQALYVAVPQEQTAGERWYPTMANQREATTIHRFELANGRARYAGSGVVKGRVLNQFAMDEWQGHLRVATTTGHLPSSDVHSTLSVLAPAPGALLTVGTLDQLAPKEDIRSVRFDGERGFVVTFKKTDPLFVFDLKDPRQPTMLAELKIPGFSTYMQLMDSTHLLTIGYDASDQGSFAWFTGVLLQIFDVSDPTQPKLAHKEVIGTRGSSSEALTNHLAFTYFPPKEILALPMTVCEGGDPSKGIYGTTMTFSGLMVYKVTAAAGFALQGKVTHGTVGATCNNWWTNASSTVKRSIIMDDYVFSVTDAAIKVNDLRNLAVDLVVLPLSP